MPDFVGDPDYTLRWPPAIFAAEVERLVRRAATSASQSDWRDEVDLLLRQAFASAVPASDFRRVDQSFSQPLGYGDDEEPF